MRMWAERVVIGLLSFLAIAIPLLFGLVTYLAFADGITISAGDPIRETRLWMVKDSRNFGIAYSAPTNALPASDADRQTCIRNSFIMLHLRGGLRLEYSAEYCRCYVVKSGNWTPSQVPCS